VTFAEIGETMARDTRDTEDRSSLISLQVRLYAPCYSPPLFPRQWSVPRRVPGTRVTDLGKKRSHAVTCAVNFG